MGADYSRLMVAYTKLAKDIQAIQGTPASQAEIDAVEGAIDATLSKTVEVLHKYNNERGTVR